MRATQLYSVIEQQSAEPGDTAEGPSLSNPFEISQEKIIEEETDDLPLINVHITETVHALFRKGQVDTSVVWGEIGVEYKGPSESATPICFQIESDKLDSVELTDFVGVLNGYTIEDKLFKINTELIHQRGTVVCVKYMYNLDKERVPLTVKPMWKCDADKSRLLIKYHKHTQTGTLENVMFGTSMTGDVQNALSIPAGELVLSQQRIKWHLEDIDNNDEQVIKAQFSTLEQATPQPVVIRFETKGQLLTGLQVHQGSDPLLLWARVCNVTKTVKTGKYIAEP
jgi:hypothetical protein